MPAAQLVQKTAPSRAAVPGSQPLQLVGATAPTAAEKVPAAQGEQLVCAAAAPKVPAPQLLQVVAPAAAEYMPSPQFRHAVAAVAPVADEAVPGTHAMQPVAIEPA